jgi:hypothetical protein
MEKAIVVGLLILMQTVSGLSSGMISLVFADSVIGNLSPLRNESQEHDFSNCGNRSSSRGYFVFSNSIHGCEIIEIISNKHKN